MKRILLVLLTVSFCFPPAYSATTNGFTRAAGKTAKVTSQTLLPSLAVLMILKGVERVRDRLRSAEIKDRKPTPKEISRAAGGAALDLLDDPSVWAGLAGNLTTTFAIAQPLSKVLTAAASHVTVHQNLAKSLQAGIMAAITTVGFQLLEQYYKDARELHEDAESYKRAGEAKNVVLGLSALAFNSSDSENKKMASEMIHALKRVAVESKLRRKLLQNLYRKQIVHGEFIMPLLGIAAATYVGFRFFRGATQSVTFAYSVAGGVLATLIPKEAMNALTDALNRGREGIVSLLYQRCQARSGLQAVGASDEPNSKEEGLTTLYEACGDFRSHVVALQLESLYRNYHRLQELLIEHREAINAGNPKVISSLHVKLERHRAGIRNSIQTIREIYGQQIDQILEVQAFAPYAAALEMNCELAKLQRILAVLNSILAALEPNILDKSFSDFDLTALDMFYEEGFSEVDLVERFYKSNPVPECQYLRDHKAKGSDK